MSNKSKQNDDRYEFNGVKLAHELMVDIWGALIPGVLFLFCLICMFSPVMYYFGPDIQSILPNANSFWIVAFLSFLILAYVLGMIFYRADIKCPDRMDIRREQESKLLIFLNDMPKGFVPKKHRKSKGGRGNSHYNKQSSSYDIIRWWKSLILHIKYVLVTPIRRRERKNKLVYNKLCRARTKYAINLLLREISPLKRSMENVLNNKDDSDMTPYNKQYLEYCCKAEKYLKQLLTNNASRVDEQEMIEFRKNILCILFPDDIDSILSFKDKVQDYETTKKGSRHKYYIIAQSIFPEISYLSLSARSVIVSTIKIVPLVHSFRTHIRWGFGRQCRIKARLFRINHDWFLERRCIDTNDEYELYNIYMVAYLILHMQNESGCATEKRCDFPYISYYKYLLKRGQIDILEYIQWSAYSRRSKNCINQYKISLQLHEPKAYSIIVKNESHIRMASSSWHVSKVIRNISWIPIIMLFFTQNYLALLFPLSTLSLSLYILYHVPQFIHYQRLREIYHTLWTYKLWKDSKKNTL